MRATYFRCRRPVTSVAMVAATLLWLLAAAVVAAEERYTGVERVVAVSDIHGAYDAMRRTLRAAGVLGDDDTWAGGATHLVITGDLLDRGADSRKVMDLMMVLEARAEEAGGRLHVLLGNHEVMNLVGDLRYVAVEEYAAFAAEETPEMRDRWFRRYLESQSSISSEETLRARFDETRPPGFFAHRAAFGSDGHYGKWLLDKPLVVVVNDTAYVHGGLSPMIGELGLEGVNGELKDQLRAYVDALGVVTDAGIIDPLENFYDHKATLESLPKNASRPPEVQAAIDTMLRLGRAELHQLDSPLWYRGNIGCGLLVEVDRLDPVLERLGASRVVIGHTPTLTRQVLSRLDGRVVEIDTGMLTDYYKGSGSALVIEAGGMTVVGEHGGESSVVRHPRHVGLRPQAFSGADLETVLAEGTLSMTGSLDDGRLLVSVTVDGAVLPAVFTPSDRGGDFNPELAAYRLDRYLELDMVPATVAREFDGRRGALQFVPVGTIDEAERIERRRGGSAWCPLPEQWNAMYVFDSLIGTPGRSQQQMHYSPEEWQLILTDNFRAFGTIRSRPDYLRAVPLAIGSAWQAKLRSLDEATIEREFADVLDRRRRAALERRRAGLLEDAARQP